MMSSGKPLVVAGIFPFHFPAAAGIVFSIVLTRILNSTFGGR
jgi:hypothetical protein